jgi:uncharacterized protein (TIGR02598 family)
MTFRFEKSDSSRPSGFTLTEVIVALGLFVFAMTAVMGVLPFGMLQVQNASNESRAMGIMESIRDDLGLAISSKMTKSLKYEINSPTGSGTQGLDYYLSESGEVIGSTGSASFRIKGSLIGASASGTEPVYLHLRATWPAKAPAGKETGSVELVSAFRP